MKGKKIIYKNLDEEKTTPSPFPFSSPSFLKKVNNVGVYYLKNIARKIVSRLCHITAN